MAKIFPAPQSPTFIIPVEGKKNQFIIGANNELKIISWDGESEKISVEEKLSTVERSTQAPNAAFNDAKCDSAGRLWAGTQSLAAELAKTEPVGSLYTYDGKGQLKSQIGGIRVANGLAFNDKTKKMFYIDSLQGTVDQFDFDLSRGTICKKKWERCFQNCTWFFSQSTSLVYFEKTKYSWYSGRYGH